MREKGEAQERQITRIASDLSYPSKLRASEPQMEAIP
jgi:hypothetical protein